jgi:epoxyqueuosine reductase
MEPLALRSKLIKKEAERIGFEACGISTVRFLEKEARELEQFLTEKRHGSMHWLENHFDKRVNPALLVDGAQSVISVLANYKPLEEHHQPEDMSKISTYAWGKDYHLVLKEKLQELMHFIEANFGQNTFRIFVDSAPVMDKAWAKESGLGWIGKHTNLIRKGVGSWFFIAEIIIDLELEPDSPVTDHCGTCTKCIDACPTEALQPYQIDASKCISYLTIELKESIPEPFQNKLEDWAFGCDICQQVCPWNSFSISHSSNWFNPLPFIKDLTREDWRNLPEIEIKKITKDSPLSRVKPDRLKNLILNPD